MNSTNGAHEFAGDATSQPGEARKGLELQLVCLLRKVILASVKRSTSVQAPRPGHEDLGKSELPSKW